MTRRFPRTEPLIPDELLAKLIENGRTSEERDDFDPFLIGMGCPELGYLSARLRMYAANLACRSNATSISGSNTASAPIKLARSAGMIFT
ncbi:MAG: hypothetical protein NTAFB05_00190 [Nitrobacter sp.]